MNNIDEKLISILPSKRQIDYLENGFNCFIHYGMNTYTKREWGDGTESPEQFCPIEVDTDEWALAVKSAGMNGIILTCKHHDGFCLWPSKYTDHSIMNSPYKNGKGDIVKELSDSCKKYGLKFGIYLSPWDRNSKYYGKGCEYDDFYINQLSELLTQYGPVFSVWLDGACGENEEGKTQMYDWDRYFKKIRELQPEAVISICGPDIRWCGNEAGQSRKSEWSVVSLGLSDPELTRSLSQSSDSSEFRMRPIDPTLEDLGSREILKNESNLIYYPAEIDVSIRPGWFYHKDEDNRVRTVENLFDIYVNSIGHNATLLLNIPIMPNGHMHDTDKERIRLLGEKIEREFRQNLAEDAIIEVSGGVCSKGKYCIAEKKTMKMALRWSEPIQVRYIKIQEDIVFSQRVEKFTVFFINDEGIRDICYRGTTIGNIKIVPLNLQNVESIEICIEDARVSAIIKDIQVY